MVDIRKAVAESGVYKYEIAHEMGITDCYFSKMLRYPDELSDEKKQQILNAIYVLQKEGK